MLDLGAQIADNGYMSSKNNAFTRTTKGFDFILMDGNMWNCTTNADGLRARVLETRIVDGGEFGRCQARVVTLLHRATRDNWEAAEAVEARLIERCEAGPAKGHTVLTTEHWDVVETGRWYYQ